MLANNLPEEYEDLTSEQEAAYLAFEEELHGLLNDVNPPRERQLESRFAGIGICSRQCEAGGGALQVIGFKPFFTQRAWRNSISAYDGIIAPTAVVFRVGNSIFDRAWYSRP